MDHDSELLFEQIVRPNRVDQRGPIAEFLAKKDAEQAKQTGSAYRTALMRFHEFPGRGRHGRRCRRGSGFRYLGHLRQADLSDKQHRHLLQVPEGVHPLDGEEGLDRARPLHRREAASLRPPEVRHADGGREAGDAWCPRPNTSKLGCLR